MIKTELVALCQQKRAEENNRKVVKKRKRKNVAIRIFIVTLFVAACGKVGNDHLESELAMAGETIEISSENTEYKTIGGTVFHKHVIVCDDDYRRKYYDNKYDGGTKVVVEYDDNGTENPNDDIVHNVTER